MEFGTMRFGTIKDAKDFLAERIVAEARREGEALSEVEREMLYFSETDWTLPDMPAVSAEFDRDWTRTYMSGELRGSFAG